MKQRNLVLMVVAVGCGLVAAFLTSQMSAKPAAVDKIDVLVASKDIAVGTQLTKDDLATSLKRKSVSKDAVPPNVIEAEEEVLEKRFSRSIRADEMINKADLTKGVVVSIPPGMSMVALPINLQNSVAGFVLPGSKVDVLASVRLNNTIRAMPILVNMLVLAVDATTQNPQGSQAFANVGTVSFAVNRQQALLIQYARARNCEMTLLLRHPTEPVSEMEKGYQIEEVLKLLQNGDIKDPGGAETPDKKPDASPAPMKTEMVKVPAANEDIPAGTPITKDLIEEKFKLIELPKDLAADAVTDLNALADDKQVLKTGLGKGQWVTKSLFGKAEPKPSPQESFNPKPGQPAEDKKVREIAIHTAGGTKVFRYEEVAPGEWKLQGEVNPNKKSDTPKTPEKVD